MGTGGVRTGAGRPGWHAKVEHCLRLSVRHLHRYGVLQGTGHFGLRWTNTHSGEETGSIGITSTAGSLRLSFSSNGTPITQQVQIDRTPCYFGGTRAWLCCPHCTRRVGVLYLRGGNFMCRRCGRLAYASQSADALGRTWRLQSKLESRLADNWARPKGMHHRTRKKIIEQIIECETAREDAVASFLARLGVFEF